MPRADVVVFEPPFPISKANTKILRQLKDRAAAANQAWALHEADKAKLRGLELTDANDAQNFAEAAQACHRNGINLLVSERKLRNELIAFYEACEPDLKAARERAFEAHEKAKADVHARLLSIGYTDEELPGSNQKSIQPLHLMTHPEVYRTRGEWDAIRSGDSLGAHRQLNRTALHELDGLINQVRKQLLGPI